MKSRLTSIYVCEYGMFYLVQYEKRQINTRRGDISDKNLKPIQFIDKKEIQPEIAKGRGYK